MAIRRFDGSNWVDCSSVRRFDGANWVDCSSIKRWDGANWIECFELPIPTWEEFNANFAGWEMHTIAANNKGKIIVDLSLGAFRLTVTDPNTIAEIYTKLYARFKNGTKLLFDSDVATKFNVRTRIDIEGSFQRINGSHEEIIIAGTKAAASDRNSTSGYYDHGWLYDKERTLDFNFYLRSGIYSAYIYASDFKATLYRSGDSYGYLSSNISPYF